MKRCSICLDTTGYLRTICCSKYIHLKCMRKWGIRCIICKKITHIKSKNEYHYVPDAPELTALEIQEQIEILEEIQHQLNILSNIINNI